MKRKLTMNSAKMKNKTVDDAPAITKSLLKKAVRMPAVTDKNWKTQMDSLANQEQEREGLSFTLEPEVASFYKSLGSNCQKTINSVLKAYMLVQEHRV